MTLIYWLLSDLCNDLEMTLTSLKMTLKATSTMTLKWPSFKKWIRTHMPISMGESPVRAGPCWPGALAGSWKYCWSVGACRDRSFGSSSCTPSRVDTAARTAGVALGSRGGGAEEGGGGGGWKESDIWVPSLRFPPSSLSPHLPSISFLSSSQACYFEFWSIFVNVISFTCFSYLPVASKITHSFFYLNSTIRFGPSTECPRNGLWSRFPHRKRSQTDLWRARELFTRFRTFDRHC